MYVLHWEGFSPVGANSCLLSYWLTNNALSCWLHWYSFLLNVCVLRRAIKSLLHEKIISLVCILKCILNLPLSENAFSQLRHWNYICPECVLRYIKLWLFLEKALSHWLHWKSFSLMCFYHMHKKVLLYKIHVTFVVLKWYISSVCLHVYIEVTIS